MYGKFGVNNSMEIIILVSLLVLGLIIGSFMNVVIYRVPRNLSIVSPGSKCSSCNSEVKPYDNIPILSYILLGGKCRKCKEKISIRYPLVELLVGILYVLCYLFLGLTVELILGLIFVTCAVGIIFIDIDFKIIPDSFIVIIGLLGIGIMVNNYINAGFDGVVLNILGFVFGLGIFLIIRLAGSMIYKKEAMGLGDVKLMAVAGLYLGLLNTFLTILISSVVASIIEVTLIKLKIRKKDDEIPFGPYLVIGMIISLFVGTYIMDWYLGLF